LHTPPLRVSLQLAILGSAVAPTALQSLLKSNLESNLNERKRGKVKHLPTTNSKYSHYSHTDEDRVTHQHTNTSISLVDLFFFVMVSLPEPSPGIHYTREWQAYCNGWKQQIFRLWVRWFTCTRWLAFLHQ